MLKRSLPLLAIPLSALAIEPKDIKLGGFVDTYYAFDFNQPKDLERQYTTQPARHNEFNINMAYLDATIKTEKTRGRMALQYGNSVDKNYSAERDSDAKVFQEAYVGKRIAEKTWIDVGIFLGNIGAESWISKDNYTYSRSLNLDYVPYYSSGVRFEHFISEKQSFQLQLLNGWQNISENNSGKAIGMQYKNLVSEKFSFIYNNFFGDEETVPSDKTDSASMTHPRFRTYHNFIFNYALSEKWQWIYVFDIGEQSQQQNKGVDAWYATTFTLRRVLNQTQSISGRVEYYNDRHQANVSTTTDNGFQVSSASINFDQKLDENALWRTELRGFYSKDEIYTAYTSNMNRLDGFLVTSLSMWF